MVSVIVNKKHLGSNMYSSCLSACTVCVKYQSTLHISQQLDSSELRLEEFIAT